MTRPATFGLLIIFALGGCTQMVAPDRPGGAADSPSAEPERTDPPADTPDAEPADDGEQPGTASAPEVESKQPEPPAEPDSAQTETQPAPEDPQRATDGAPAESPATEPKTDDRAVEARQEPEPEPIQAQEQGQQRAEAPQSSPPGDPAEPRRSLTGTIALTGGDADVTESVIYFVPDERSRLPEAANESAGHEIVTRNKTLSPAVLAVSTGSEVQFPNNDPILHNLFSVSSGNGFDLGVYEPGQSPSVTFDQPGVVNIYCNVHHDMHAHVLVVDTPWRTRADRRGRFRLEGLPDADGTLHVWHRQAESWSRAVDFPVEEPLDIALAVTRPKLPPHRDKTGQPYNRRDRDPYR